MDLKKIAEWVAGIGALGIGVAIFNPAWSLTAIPVVGAYSAYIVGAAGLLVVLDKAGVYKL